MKRLVALTCLSDSRNVVSSQDGGNAVRLDRCRSRVLAQLHIRKQNGVQAGVIELWSM